MRPNATMTTNAMYQSAGMRPNQMYEARDMDQCITVGRTSLTDMGSSSTDEPVYACIDTTMTTDVGEEPACTPMPGAGDTVQHESTATSA